MDNVSNTELQRLYTRDEVKEFAKHVTDIVLQRLMPNGVTLVIDFEYMLTRKETSNPMTLKDQYVNRKSRHDGGNSDLQK